MEPSVAKSTGFLAGPWYISLLGVFWGQSWLPCPAPCAPGWPSSLAVECPDKSLNSKPDPDPFPLCQSGHNVTCCFWHYQYNPLTPFIHCSDTIHSKYSIFNKKNLTGWVGGWPIPSGNITTSWLHLASWNLLDFQLSWKSKMEPSVAIYSNFGNFLMQIWPFLGMPKENFFYFDLFKWY